MGEHASGMRHVTSASTPCGRICVSPMDANGTSVVDEESIMS